MRRRWPDPAGMEDGERNECGQPPEAGKGKEGNRLSPRASRMDTLIAFYFFPVLLSYN